MKRILFGDEMVNLVKKGQYDLPMACLWFWVYFLAMEGCHSDWVVNAFTEYLDDNKFKMVLGNNLEGESAVSTHSFYRLGTKAVTNSFQTRVRKLASKK